MAILGATTLTGCDSIPDFIETAAYMIFKQTTAPTSWTKLTTNNDAILRVVSGTVTTGGTANFSAAFATRTPTGSVGGTTLATTQIPSHAHPVQRYNTSNSLDFAPNPSRFWTFTAGSVTDASGGGLSHDHPVSVNSLDFNVKYVDIIIASKD